ncbi:tryptophan-rich_sensory protein [Hexamita inflata]|uniref:Tryptophan-rich sensory protein n=1 Tax=Hexamita inflata TaxID=28002 RepID=A0AA86NR46_9EUKA|nr:tryptophan-rich sensory protein [Hexamita inflata]CAI9971824.1 tryptophan-rich sensory protein [Hexamita inflata]
MFFKILAGLALVAQFVINFLYMPKDTSDEHSTLITPPGITFGICWSIIYILQVVQILYIFIKIDEKETENKVLLATQTLMSVFNLLWVLLFELYRNWLGQMIDIIILYFVLLFHLTYTRTLKRGWDILIKLFGGIYAGWITQAQMIAITVYSNSLDKSKELKLCRVLLIASVVLDVLVTFVFKNGYVCVPQFIAFLTSLSALADRTLHTTAIVGMVLDVLLIIWQVGYEIYSWKKFRSNVRYAQLTYV